MKVSIKCAWCGSQIEDPWCVEFEGEKFHDKCFKEDAAEILFQYDYARWYDLDDRDLEDDEEPYDSIADMDDDSDKYIVEKYLLNSNST